MLVLSACATPATHPATASLRVPLAPREALAVLPQPSPFGPEADRALGAALLVSSVLDARPSGRPIYNVLQLASLGETDCLLDADWSRACLESVHAGPSVWVRETMDGLVLTLHPGAERAEQVLGPLDPTLPVETLRRTLDDWLALTDAPPPRDPQESARREQGRCLSLEGAGAAPARLEMLGRASRQRQQTLQGEHPATRPAGMSPSSQSPTPQISLPSPTLFERTLLTGPPERSTLEALLPAPCGFGLALQALHAQNGISGAVAEGEITAGLLARQRPLNDLTLLDWALALQHADRTSDSVTVLQRALWLAPTRLKTRRTLANGLLRLERSADARRVLVEGLTQTTDPGQQAVLELDLGRLEEEASPWKSAILHYERGLGLLALLEEPEASAEDAMLTAKMDARNALKAELLNALGAARVSAVLNERMEPDHQSLSNAQQEAQSRTLQAAAEALQQAVALRETRLAQAGTTAPLSGAVSEASPAEALANSLYNLGICQSQQDDWPAAVASLTRAATLYGGEAGLHTLLDLARILHEAGLTTDALQTLALVREASEKHGEPLPAVIDAEWHYLHALARNLAGETAAALEELTQTADQYQALYMPLEEARTWFNLGIIAEHEGLLSQAIEAFARARSAALKAHDNASVLDIEARIEALERKGAVLTPLEEAIPSTPQ